MPSDMNIPLRILKDLLVYWRSVMLIAVPLLFLPIPIASIGSESAAAWNCAYVVIIMAFYWIFELVPIAVTAFLPMILYPIFGVISIDVACAPYLSKSNWVMFGGLIMAIAIEEVNLHKRIALRVLLWMGSEPKWILFGFMITTWFLSFWMSNTATTAMMMPIALAVINELVKYRIAERRGDQSRDHEQIALEVKRPNPETGQLADAADNAPGEGAEKEPTTGDGSTEEDTMPAFDQWHDLDKKLAKCILISICYSSSIGGCATLTGTVPNVIVLEILEQYDIKDVSYATWMASQVPPAIFLILACYLWMQVLYFPIRDLCPRKGKVKNVGFTKVLQTQYDQLGKMNFGEKTVFLLYVLLVALWVLRDPKFMPGWGALFREKFVKDATPVMAISFLLFTLPKELPQFLCFRGEKSAAPKLSPPLLTWGSMKKFPWDVIILLGGGFAMAKGVSASGLAGILGAVLKESIATAVSPDVFIFLTIIVVTFFTDVTSNVAIANIFLPMLVPLALEIEVNPIKFAVPTAVACSYAYMLPVSTPPNAIVFGSGMVQIKDMIIAGFMMNLISIAIQTFSAVLYMPVIFDLSYSVIEEVAKNTTCNATEIEACRELIANCTSNLTTAGFTGLFNLTTTFPTST